MEFRLDSTLATQFARSTLGHVGREYPHVLVHVLAGPEPLSPAGLHPIFHGSYDWHSCVHGWWQLLRIARLSPDTAAEIADRANAAFTPEKVAGELAYLRRHPSFERPYGWAWLLSLHSEAQRHDAPWSDSLAPIARLIAQRFGEYLPKLGYPVRAGTHANTAFALIWAHEWALENDPDLAEAIEQWADSRFANDRAAAHQEPSGEDFLSPTLTEALLMARVLPSRRFEAWFHTFLPDLPRNLLEPVEVLDRTDGRIGHLDGLNLSRAWCWRGLASRIPEIRGRAAEGAERHLEAALPHVAANYMAEHWLATFALLALIE
ncbi:MAG: DUF2891 domain-containing protein [Fimbriimonas sp.]